MTYFRFHRTLYGLATAAAVGLLVGAGTSVHAETVTFKQGSSISELGIANYQGTTDTQILSRSSTNTSQNFAATNYGGQTGMALGTSTISGGGTYVNKSILRFDVSSLQGEVGSIDSATLSLRMRGTSGSNAATLSLWQITSENADWQEDHATWNLLYDPTPNGGTGTETGEVAWNGSAGLSTAGDDYQSFSNNTQVLPANSPNATWVTWTLPSQLIESWVNTPADNAGLLITSDGDYVRFGASEYTDGGYRPKLTITYTAIPEPGGLSLLGLGGMALLLSRRRRG